MQFRWREMFTSKVGAEARWDSWDFVALALAVFIATGVFALRRKTFYALGYSGGLLVSAHPASAWRGWAVRCGPGRGSSRLSNFGFFLPGVVPWIPRRGSRPRVMFTPVLFPASTAADSVNRDRPRRH